MESPQPTTRRHWPDIARRWALVGTPLRPIAEDLELITRAIARWSAGARAPRALILGVTPEFYRLPWPAGTDLRAADHTPAMIDAVWPGPRSAVACAQWTDLPFGDGSRDIALCDGGVHLMSHPREHERFVRSLHRVLTPGGYCILRLFAPAGPRESRERVLADLLAGRISSLNILKLRLGMALQESAVAGVQLARVWQALHDAAPDFPRLAAQISWPLEHLLAIDTYRDCAKHYHFVTLEEVRRMFCESPGGFAVESVDIPTYELGERCPIVVLRRENG